LCNKDLRKPQKPYRWGIKLFTLTYALQSIVKHKRRSLIIIIGFIIDVSMVSAILTWTDTGPMIFAKDHLERSLQLSLSKPDSFQLKYYLKRENYSYSIWDTYAFAERKPLVGKIEVVYSSMFLFNTENKSDSYVWFPESTEPMVRGPVFIANDTFLSLFQDQLRLEGNLTLGENGVLLSRSLISQLNNTFGTFKIGSNLSFALATRIAEFSPTKENTLGYWKRVFFKDLTIKGIYDWIPRDSLADRELTTKKLSSNSMFMPLSLVNAMVLRSMEYPYTYSPGPPKLFIQLNAEEVARHGIENLGGEIDRLKMEIFYSFESEIYIYTDIDQVSKFIEAYSQFRTLLIYILPVVNLSVGTTILSSEVVFGGRKQEAGILRARGASSHQLYILFIIEFLLLALIGVTLGFFLGVFLGCLIPATNGLFQYDPVTFKKFLTYATFSQYNFLFAFLACGVPPLIYAFSKAKSYASMEAMRAITQGARSKGRVTYTVGLWEIEVKGVSISYIFFAGLLATLVFIKRVISNIPLTMGSGIPFYILLLLHWSLLIYATALIMSKALPILSRAFTFLLGTKGLFLMLNFKRQRIFVPLMMILMLTSSIMVFSLVEAETTKENISNQIRYAIGCDLRIYTTHTQPISFAQSLTKNFSHLISNATPVIHSYFKIGNFYITVIGVDPMLYKNMGFWVPASFESPIHEQALISLARNPNGVLINKFLSDTLSLDPDSQVEVTLPQPMRLTVAGIIRSAPGFGDANSEFINVKGNLGFQERTMFVIVNKDLLVSMGIDKTSLFFASAKEGTDMKETVKILSKLPGISDVYSPSTFNLSNVDIDRFLYMQGVVGSLTFQFLITIFIGIVSLSFFLGYMISKRGVEYAVMRAIGATRKDITTLIFTESLEVVLFSLIAGSIIGLAYSIVLFDLSLWIFPFSSLVPYTPIVPITTLFVSFVMLFLAMSLGSYLPARRAGRTAVTEMLRNL